MKVLAERPEIARAMNFGKYPVLEIDIAKCDEYGLVGSKCRIDMGYFNDGEKWYERATLRVFRDENKISFHSHGYCLSAEHGYHDYIEDLAFAKAPIVKPDSEMLIFMHDSNEKQVYCPRVVKTGKITKHCISPIVVEDVDMSHLISLARDRYHKW